MDCNFFKKIVLKKLEKKQITSDLGVELYNKYKENDELGVCFLEETDIEQNIESKSLNSSKRNILIFTDKLDWPINIFENKEFNPIFVFPNEKFERITDYKYNINLSKIDDYISLIQNICEKDIDFSLVLYYWDKEDITYQQKLDRSIFSIFCLTKTLMSNSKKVVELLFINKKYKNKCEPVYEGLEGFFKSLYAEDCRYKFKLVNISKENDLYTALDEYKSIYKPNTVGYINGIRRVKTLKTLNINMEVEEELNKTNGVYIICGGTGGIGKTLALHLASNYHATLLLIGHRDNCPDIQNFIKKIESSGGEASYYQIDLRNKDEVDNGFYKIKQKYKNINGLIYCVGTLNDKYLRNKDFREVEETVEAKATGLTYVDSALENSKIDYFLIFSSMSSVIGIPGQCDYAYANSFCDRFSEERSLLVNSGKRTGKTISINWSIWKDSNMGLNDSQKAQICETLEYEYGITPMGNEEGVIILEKVLETKNINQCISLYGKHKKIEEIILNNNLLCEKKESRENARKLVVDIFCKTLNISKDKLSCTNNLREFGIDSIMVNRFNKLLTETIGNVPQTILYECETINDVVSYLLDNDYINNKNESETAEPVEVEVESNLCGLDIAVIGMKVDTPGADDNDKFWTNLICGKNAVTEVPVKRWDNDIFYSTNKEEKNKTYCKRGGFLENIEMFDAAFFGISPREAKIMDPQERLFLQNVWHAIEDSGYSVSELQKNTNNKVGVFVGVTSNTYMLWADNQLRHGLDSYPQSYPWSIANRISYTLNLHGPSVAIDTACSSSLTALHQACQSIKNNECKVAIVGGVNLCLHPLKYIMQSNMNMLSANGNCSSFSENADGYVPGEGICSVILKPYKQAIKDKDCIYGVIKGTAINHGGTTSGYTVPNPIAQKSVIEKALSNSNVPKHSIGYIEAHGTGTILGDPIEIEGIKKAYSDAVSKHCAIGSLKSNIGHTESASGILSLAKVLLQLYNKQLVPSINALPLNSRISLEGTPFYIIDKCVKWERERKNEIDEKPLCAGVSSFGAGGSNVHVIVQEDNQDKKVDKFSILPIMVLSAKTKKALEKKSKQLIEFINNKSALYSFSDFIYTIQASKDSFDERLAFIAEDYQQVLQGLNKFLSGDLNELCYSNVRNEVLIKELVNDEMFEPKSLIEYWISGGKIDFNNYYKNKHTRIKLPLYPFDLKRYWYEENNTIENKNIINCAKYKKFDLDKELEKFKIQTTGNEVNFEIVQDTIAIIKITDIENSNMLTQEVYFSLLKCFKEISKYQEIKAVILTGKDNIFCMGGSPKKLEEIAERKEKCSDASIVFEGLLNLDIPVISAIQGHAMGGGLVLGLFADIIIMSEESIFSSNFMNYGFTPGVGSTFILKEKLGTNLSFEMMYTAKEYTGKELKERGVDFIFEKKDNVLPEAINIAKRISNMPLISLKTLKTELASRYLERLAPIIDSEMKMHDKVFTSGSTNEFQSRIAKYYKHESTKDSHSRVEKVRLSDDLYVNDNETLDKEENANALNNRKIVLIDTKNQISNTTKAEKTPTIPNDVSGTIIKLIADVLRMELCEIDTRKTFHELGFDSITAMEFIRNLNMSLNIKIESSVIYDCKSVQDFIVYAQEKSGLVFPEINKGQENDKCVSNTVKKYISDILQNKEDINLKLSFTEIGFDSITAMELIKKINEFYKIRLESFMIYDCKDINAFINLVEKAINPTINEEEKTRDIIHKMKAGHLSIEDAEAYMEEIYGPENYTREN
ncbi:SDR family NAD(P)-dependent oxidoreductase [Blautia producta]|uniref:SDR family NAD(P)-dependent oxidoreductase n=1 Tax=Blautia producta TaxID=33035 RepID=UPI00290DAA4E|nr:SDR family NAD(P)-dependent oxidoreductase [Enterococcus faecium]